MLRKFIQLNLAASRLFDKLLPAAYRVDGNRDFAYRLAPSYVTQGISMVDVGGGKTPFLSPAGKQALQVRVTGVDISADELQQAPSGAYDAILCGDIAGIEGKGDADLVICQAVLEHVQDTGGAIRSIASFLKPGGMALIFVPSRNAVYARLNLLLPEELKKKLLYWVYPDVRRTQGFPSYYDRCTPRQFKAMAAAAGLEVVEARYYFVSTYFAFLFPLYVAWRVWLLLFKQVAGEQAAETFSLVLRKRSDKESAGT